MDLQPPEAVPGRAAEGERRIAGAVPGRAAEGERRIAAAVPGRAAEGERRIAAAVPSGRTCRRLFSSSPSVAAPSVHRYQPDTAAIPMDRQSDFSSAPTALHEMARGRRSNIIRSNEEYLSEELFGHNSYQKTYTTSYLDASTEEDQFDWENNNEIISPGNYKAAIGGFSTAVPRGRTCKRLFSSSSSVTAPSGRRHQLDTAAPEAVPGQSDLSSAPPALHEMARGRRKNIIRSNEEYLSEELIGHNSYQKTYASSDLDASTEEDQFDRENNNEIISPGHHQDVAASEFDPTSTGDPTVRDDDIELSVEEETEEGTRRGKTKLKHVWNILKGHRIVVNCNEFDQPIGEEAGVLGKFLGMVARNGYLCSLSYKDWRLLIRKKERTSNEQKNKDDILKQVKKRFLYPARMEKWVLRTIGERWRQHKCNLKSVYFDAHKSKEANYNNAPEGVVPDQWIALVNNWMTPKAQDISEENKMHCAKRKAIHTAGTKSFARNREELREKDPEKKNPHRATLYIHTHQPNSSKNTNAHVGDLKDLLVQHPDLADTSQGKVAWNGDALTRILGEEKPGHVHGLGLVPNPDKVLDCSKSGCLKNLNVTSLDATSSKDVVSLRLQVEKLVNHVHNQDATIQNLKQKTISMEQQQRQQGCLGDPLSAPSNVHTTSKRKRVYVDHPSQEYRMHDGDTLNYTTGEQRDDEFDDLHPSYKKTYTIEKKQMKAAMARERNLRSADRVATAHKAKPKEFHIDNRLDNNNCATASKGMNKERTSNCSKQVKYQVGTPVHVKSWRHKQKTVALGRISSTDPNDKVGGLKLGTEFLMLDIGLIVVRDEPLIRPYDNFKVLGDVGNNLIAWPSSCVAIINKNKII